MVPFILHWESYIYLVNSTSFFLLELGTQLRLWLLEIINKSMVSLPKYFSQMNQVLDWDILIAIIWITNFKFWKLGEGSMWLTSGNEAITWSSNIWFLELINSKCKWNWSELSIFCWIYSTSFKYPAMLCSILCHFYSSGSSAGLCV